MKAMKTAYIYKNVNDHDFFFFFKESFNLWRSFMIIALLSLNQDIKSVFDVGED